VMVVVLRVIHGLNRQVRSTKELFRLSYLPFFKALKIEVTPS
jgi:hypothetical protein